MAQRATPVPFLTKTYQLVDDESTNDVVSWNGTGTAFVVWKMADFARDLLPNYFKHNNFSSFVRQLNTYGFRKTVADKWEFANDHFRRGEKELLSQIRRREHVAPPPATNPSPSNSSGPTSTSASPSVETVVANAQHADLSGENEKLRKENESLRSELARTKKRCQELVGFLTECLKMEPEQIDRIMRQGGCGPSDDEDNGNGEGGDGVRLFGVWVKKRGREDKMECGGRWRKVCN